MEVVPDIKGSTLVDFANRSNAKAFIGGTYHGLDSKHLQAYLSEFCYRFNRRKFKGELFNRLLSCYSSTHVITFSELTA
jgi:hypothetical protein